MIDFSPTPEQEQLRRITSQLMERYVYPVEEHLTDTPDPEIPSFFPGIPDSVLRPIQAKVKELGLWAPHMPEDAGGMGIGVVGLGLMNEIIGRSPLGPVSFGCQAPDAGNWRSSTCTAPRSRSAPGSSRTWPATSARASR